MWNLWTGIVSTVPGCMRMTGGWKVEPVEAHGVLRVGGMGKASGA